MTSVPLTAAEHEQHISEMMSKLRELGGTINGFKLAASGRRSRIANAATLPIAFLEAIAAACDSNPQLAAAGEITGQEIRDSLRITLAHTSAANEARILAKGLEDTAAEQSSDVGYRCLRVYKYAQSVNKPEDRQSLIPHLDTMRRALGKTRGARRLTDAEKQAAQQKQQVK